MRPLEGRIAFPVILLVDLIAAAVGWMITVPDSLGILAGHFMGIGA